MRLAMENTPCSRSQMGGGGLVGEPTVGLLTVETWGCNQPVPLEVYWVLY